MPHVADLAHHLVVLSVLLEQAFILHIFSRHFARRRVIFSRMSFKYILHQLFYSNWDLGEEEAFEDVIEVGVYVESVTKFEDGTEYRYLT